ncbi:MFS permease [Cronobacter dublinensis 1210]|uniref:MFS permease n=1 Tax=Cronobacter dublinensis 1210 TaxID=1208656 RepID=A0ABP1WCZ5_9ENTR|nr:MFS transporter [Cronobacter dublinensis]ALB68927.1 MFS transporter [Cronobacter dublinensis subsp. dublinensis LMG 23823]MDI7274240.1 MFS transporter [Cronobacter dublinensis]CCJ82419.1 MFS permease [Cronobacter dublinensis 1210]
MAQVNDVHTASAATPPVAASSWAPLRQPVFRMLWIATVVSNIGSWMNDVGINWTMLTLSADPLAVALVQAASSLPMFLFALPSGVMADIVDRRKYLLFSQLWVFIAAAGLTLLSAAGLVTPGVLLVAAFLLSAGAAMSSPPFQAIVPDLVDKHELAPAVALNSLGINISRAIGPALGGLVLSFAGPWVVFALNALSVLGVAWVLWRWKTPPAIQRLPPEHFFPAVRAGLRYVHAAPVLRNVLVRTVAFFTFASAGWALLPLVARRELGLGPGGYGIMLACIGIGAVCGAVVLPRLRKRFDPDRLMALNSAMFAVSMLALAFIRHVWLLNTFLFLTGFAWIAVLSTLNMGAQRSAAKWVKARALAVYLTFFFGAMTAGSALWGQLASHFSIATALCVATVGLLLASLTARRWKLNKDPDLNLEIRDIDSRALSLDISHERGPVMVMYEYHIDPDDVYDFVVCIQEIRRVRQRGGALSWSVYEDIQRPGVFIESFVIGTWIEHLRQQERHTVNDLLIQSRVQAFHRGEASPAARYFIAP